MAISVGPTAAPADARGAVEETTGARGAVEETSGARGAVDDTSGARGAVEETRGARGAVDETSGARGDAAAAGASTEARGATGASTDGSTLTAAVYLFDTIDLSDQWQLSAGLRFERYRTEFTSVPATAVPPAASASETAMIRIFFVIGDFI